MRSNEVKCYAYHKTFLIISKKYGSFRMINSLYTFGYTVITSISNFTLLINLSSMWKGKEKEKEKRKREEGKKGKRERENDKYYL